MIFLNYFLMLQFAVLAVGWWFAQDKVQAVYWMGAFFCTAGVTFK